jgi:hypothetical protein
MSDAAPEKIRTERLGWLSLEQLTITLGQRKKLSDLDVN